MVDSPARIAIIGMGGYAARHHDSVEGLEQQGLCRLGVTCDPDPERFREAAKKWRLEERGVRIYTDYREMLARHARELDVVIIPTPIPLHAEMHQAAVEAGLAAYLEKPPTLDPDELEDMIERDRRARVPTLVGFNFIAEPVRQGLKRRLLSGEFGSLRSARLIGLWGRSASYYRRTGWAGRLIGDDGRLILDSCLGNGLSHHVHNLLHWAGLSGPDDWARPTRVLSQLLRAHPIQGPDTVFLSAETGPGIRLRLALSHACHGPDLHVETLDCDQARIEYITHSRATICWKDGAEERITLPAFDAQTENLMALIECVKGLRPKPPTTLVDCRPFVHLHALAYVSSGQIADWPADEILGEAEDTTPGCLQIRNLREKAVGFLENGQWPTATPPREVTAREVDQLQSVVRSMVLEKSAAIYA
ncbi:MAG: Gfo/Idh/MocA family oxidoreductase [Terrimicrobiaceae bacterium]|nr:Gfo/Idh/MocA family oxidoreductase [Terrimicrobiaceae bacterium]